MKRVFVALRIATVLVAPCGLGIATANADAPAVIPYQGRLTNLAGQPVNATLPMTFALYEVPADGTAAMRLLRSFGTASAQGVTLPQPSKSAALSHTRWVTETVKSEGDVGQYRSLVLDRSGAPHISYYDATHGTLEYAVLSGTTWPASTVDTNVGGSSSLALDGSDKPHIAYTVNMPSVHHAVLSGTTWLIYYDATNDDLKYAHLQTRIYLPLVVRG